MYDAIIIGAGVVGCSVAAYLSRYEMNLAVLERENDVAMGSTRANSAIVHAGYDPLPGTLMAKYNVRGSMLYSQLCKKLSVPYQQIGSLVLAFSPQEDQVVRDLYDRGIKNGVPGLQILTKEQALAKEPNLSEQITSALYAPTGAIVSPWEFAIAMAENANQNGTAFFFDHPVTGIEKIEGGYHITAGGDTFESRIVINAAGTHADQVNDMVAPHTFSILPNKGQYYVLDKNQSGVVHSVIFQCPSKVGKGVLVSPTVHGNLIVGPDAVDVASPDDCSTDREGLQFVVNQAMRSTSKFQLREAIRNFAGVRAHSDQDDFIIGPVEGFPGFFNLAGIKSPGLTSAPAIGEDMIRILKENGFSFSPKDQVVETRDVVVFHNLDHQHRAEMVKKNPLYGRVICRCETITEGEIVDALHRPLPPHTIDGIKRRCGCGLGRCQGGFCGPRVQEIIARELGIPYMAVEKDKTGSYIILAETKQGGVK